MFPCRNIDLVILFIFLSNVCGRPTVDPVLILPKFRPSEQSDRINLNEDVTFLHKTIYDYSPEVQKLLLADFQDPEVMPGMFEGDIAGFHVESYLNWRLGLKWETFPERKWINNTVPYYISKKYSPDEKKVIQAAISTLNFLTCVKFIPYDGITEDYILIWPIEKPAGCWSYIGRTGGQQPLSLSPPENGNPKCLGSVGKPIHELLHALGVFHEHSRADRDDFITIQTDNIIPKFLHNFKKASLLNTTISYNYDYNSIMHYGDKFFSVDRKKPSIIPKNSSATIGQRKMLSHGDCLKVNQLYGCLDENKFSTLKYKSLCKIFAI